MWINRVRQVANPSRGQLNREKWIFPCPRSRLRIWSRETGSAAPSRASLLISILRLNHLVLTYGIPPEFRGGVLLFIQNRHNNNNNNNNGSVPSSSGHAIACRWRSLPRVRRLGASKPQGSSKQVLPWQVTIDQLICLSFPTPTIYWYEVSIGHVVRIESTFFAKKNRGIQNHAIQTITWRGESLDGAPGTTATT